MSYYYTKTLNSDFDSVLEKVTEKLKEKGFGVLTEIDVQSVLRKKLDVDFYKYKILGACNPQFAYEALQMEDKIGLMLPCNIIVQQKNATQSVQVSAIDPVASMSAIDNQKVKDLAGSVRDILRQIIDELE